MNDSQKLKTLPVLPLKNTVLFPHVLVPLAAGRPGSRAAVEAAMATEGKEIVIVSQRDASVESPSQEDLFGVGVIAVIRRISRTTEDATEIMVQGVERVSIVRFEQGEPYATARVQKLPLPTDGGTEVEALARSVIDLAAKAIVLTQGQSQMPASEDLGRLLAGTDDPMRLVFLVGSMLPLDLEKEQSLLEAPTRADALRLMYSYLSHEVQVLELRGRIAQQAGAAMSKEQREYLLRQQLRAIQQELGDKNPEQAESEALGERLKKADLPDEVRKEAERELARLERMPPAAPDYHLIRTYLDYVLELPWRVSTEDQLDVRRAREILDEDHFNLKEVKERILEQLSVLKLNPKAKAPILCFVGPPGVGKTSLGQSIARALGRKFERMSLGGLHDEAELRGHRRTYIGAMPGRLIQALRRAGANNPVLMLDEVDKLGHDYRGDPAAALLEVLDPEQNSTFRDNYLDLAFDLSKVFFITTANALDTIPRPLLDRMEILRLAGYSEEEKMEIARRYLIPRQLERTGITPEQCGFGDAGLRALIANYTREAGLRRLEQAIGKIARKAALRLAEGQSEPVLVDPDNLGDLLGPEPFHHEQIRKSPPPGIAIGLAWTEAGGDVLYVESTLLPKGKGLTLTGQLGEVMQESVKAAQSYLWAHADKLGIDPSVFESSGVHLHVPAGAIPKDGPSAGVTAAVAMASMYTRLPASDDLAMTGEVTLAGLVLPIGGLKEKVLAARRAGLGRVIVPAANRKDLRDLPDHVQREMEFIFVERIEDVLTAAIPHLSGRLALVG